MDGDHVSCQWMNFSFLFAVMVVEGNTLGQRSIGLPPSDPCWSSLKQTCQTNSCMAGVGRVSCKTKLFDRQNIVQTYRGLNYHQFFFKSQVHQKTTRHPRHYPIPRSLKKRSQTIFGWKRNTFNLPETNSSHLWRVWFRWVSFWKGLLLGDMSVFRSCKWNCTPYKWPYKSQMLHGWHMYLHLPWDIYDGQSVPHKIHGSLDVPGIRIKGFLSIRPYIRGPQLQFEPRKTPLLLSIESWLVNRDPYFMVYYISLYHWVVCHPQTIP